MDLLSRVFKIGGDEFILGCFYVRVQNSTRTAHFRFYGVEFRLGLPHLGFEGHHLIFGILHSLFGYRAAWSCLP